MCRLYSTQKMKGLPLYLWEHGLKHIDLQICRSWSSSLAISDHVFSLNKTFLLKPQTAQAQYDSLIINMRGLLMAVRLAYKSSSNFSQTRSVSGKFFMFSAAKASERARARLVFPAKNRLKSCHFVANYLRPCHVCCRQLSKYVKTNKYCKKFR